MRARTWLPTKGRPPSNPKVPDDLRAALDAQILSIIGSFKKRFCKPAKKQQFNQPIDCFARWHRQALYVVVVMQTPHGRPSTFETHAARMEHVGDGKSDLAVPMRRGWKTIEKGLTVQACLKKLGQEVYF